VIEKLGRYLTRYFKSDVRKKFLDSMLKKGHMKTLASVRSGFVEVRNALMAEFMLTGGANRMETAMSITLGDWCHAKEVRYEEDGHETRATVAYLTKHKTSRGGGVRITITGQSTATLLDIFTRDVRRGGICTPK